MDTQDLTDRLRGLQQRLAGLDPQSVQELQEICDSLSLAPSLAPASAPSVRAEDLGKYGLCSAAAMLRKRAKAATYQAGTVPPAVAAAYKAAADVLAAALADPAVAAV